MKKSIAPLGDRGQGRRDFLYRGTAALSAAALPWLVPRSARADGGGKLQAGEGVVDVTPPLGIELAGFHRPPDRPRVVLGIRQPSTVRALVLAVGDQRAAIVGIDMLGVSADFTRRVQAAVERQAGIPAGNVHIVATHTHTMPTLKPLRQWGRVFPEYMAKVQADTLRAVQMAKDDLAPAEMLLGKGARRGATSIARIDSWKTDDKFDGSSTDADRWLDTTLTALLFRRSGGKPDLLWYHYSAHPVCFQDEMAGSDWPGMVATMMHASHKLTPCYLQGNAGDVNPGESKGFGIGKAEPTSQAIHKALVAAVDGAKPVAVDRMRVVASHVDLPLDLPRMAGEIERYRSDPAQCNQGEWVDAVFAADWFADAQKWDPSVSTFARSPVGDAGRLAGDRVSSIGAVQLLRIGDQTRLAVRRDAGPGLYRRLCRLSARSGGLCPRRIRRAGRAQAGWRAAVHDRSRTSVGSRGAGAAQTTGGQGMSWVRAVSVVSRRFFRRAAACCFLGLGLASWGTLAAQADDLPRPLDPAAALETIHVPAGFRVELLAAEPLIAGPVAFDWGPDGKFWVAEMIDYPLGLDGQGQPGGRICYLEDTDGDGRFDRRTSFLDGVAFPNGVMAWRDGVLVTAAGELFFARDTDGDGRADERKTLYSGFVPGNQQHRVNGPRWGMDGWCYLANGDSGGLIKSQQTGASLDISGRDLRVRPDDGSLETVTGMTQFGRTADDWGHWFGSNNSNPGYQFVLEDRYLKRNPHIAPPSPKFEVVSPATLLHPLSVTIQRFNEPHSANHYTSACGATIYRDHLLGAELAGNYFVCEPSHNLVERQTLTRTNLVYRGQPADPGAHFIRSSDNWFRPVMCRTGIDGALWVADFYRGVLEHPQYIPDEIEARLDLRAGADRGRIYRVVRQDAPPRWVPRYSDLDAVELAGRLDSPNGTERDLVQRTLLWCADERGVPPLTRLARESQTPVVRAQVLWTLDGLDALTEEALLAALADRDPAVRAQAIQLAERHLPAMPKLGPALVALATSTDSAGNEATDGDVDVEMQLAYLLRDIDGKQAAGALGKLIVRHAGDPFPYLTAAALSSIDRENIQPVLATVLAAGNPDPHVMSQLLANAAALGAEQRWPKA